MQLKVVCVSRVVGYIVPVFVPHRKAACPCSEKTLVIATVNTTVPGATKTLFPAANWISVFWEQNSS